MQEDISHCLCILHGNGVDLGGMRRYASRRLFYVRPKESAMKHLKYGIATALVLLAMLETSNTYAGCTSRRNVFGGQDISCDDGTSVSTRPNVFGGYDSSDGTSSRRNVFGGQDYSDGRSTRPNVFGGRDSSDGTSSRRNVFGGQDLNNGTSCRPNVFGGMDCR
jgi:hypothetical protein